MEHGATDLQDDHYQQVQEETGAAHGLPENVSFKDSAASDDLIPSLPKLKQYIYY